MMRLRSKLPVARHARSPTPLQPPTRSRPAAQALALPESPCVPSSPPPCVPSSPPRAFGIENQAHSAAN
eukprot:1082358-Rhodomonas_salina.1